MLKKKSTIMRIDPIIEEKQLIHYKYKSYGEKNIIFLKIIFRKMPIRCILLYVYLTLFFSISIFTTSENITDLISWLYISFPSTLISFSLCTALCYKYLNNFKHIYISIEQVFLPTILLIFFIYQLFYIMRFLTAETFLYVILFTFFGFMTIHLFIYAHRIVRKNFSTLYYMINDKIYFDYSQYRRVLNDFSFIYCKILFSLMAVALFHGLYAKSFYSERDYAIGMGVISLALVILIYPFCIYATYMLFFVHPRVAEIFNQPVLSDQWGFFELDAALAEKYFGPNPVKRPIRYEEVFPQKESV